MTREQKNREMAAKALKRHIEKAIVRTYGENFFSEIEVFADFDERNDIILAWEGPLDWTMILAGSALDAGARGDFSKADSKLFNAIGEIEALRNVFFQANNHYQIAVYNQ